MSAKGRDRGQVTIEFLGMTPLIILTLVLMWQFVLVGYTFTLAGNAADEAVRAGTAARAGARSASLRQGAQPACSDAVSARLTVVGCPASFGSDTVTVTASIHIPSVIPGYDGFGNASKTATMPLDH
jgi:uncharacterized protein (UPF0333 family)